MKEEKEKNFYLDDFDLSIHWNQHWIIEQIRVFIQPLIKSKFLESDILFDPQDLEHQVLFYLTTYNPSKITNKIIEDSLEEQYLLIRERLLKNFNKKELEYLFRGLSGKAVDLNVNDRLKLVKINGTLFAVNETFKLEVEFKKMDNLQQAYLFTSCFHYIHQDRCRGDVFGFYFKGDEYPWAIETTENAMFAREYKKEALIYNGLNPENVIELTRYYTLPGSPLNSISMIDSLVKKYYKKNNKKIEALITATMPSYSKSKSTTISGGLNNVLCVKELEHYFVKRKIDNNVCWQHVSKRYLENFGANLEIKKTDKNFYLFPKVDVFMKIDCKNNLVTKKNNLVMHFL